MFHLNEKMINMLVVKSVTANAAVLSLLYKRIIQFMLIFVLMFSIIGLIYTNNTSYMLCMNLVLRYVQLGQHCILLQHFQVQFKIIYCILRSESLRVV